MTSKVYNIFAPLISVLPMRISIYILYIRRFHKIPNLQNPVTFTEKIQKRKLYDQRELFTIVADKLKVKEYIKSLNLDIYIPKVLWEGSVLENLDLSNLPKKSVFKANHASKTNYFIFNGDVSIEYLENLRNQWFSINQDLTLGEWAYKNINKKVFIEEFLDFEGGVPDDYKFFVYHGKVKFIQYDSGRFNRHTRNIFDKDWNDLKFKYSHDRLIPSPKKPKFISKMLEYADIIGQDFDFIRVDFYFYKGKITIGELTVYPGAGYEKFPSKKWDIEFGKYWKQNY